VLSRKKFEKYLYPYERDELKNPAASCEESSIPMERKHTYGRSLTPKQASRNALAVGFIESLIIVSLVVISQFDCVVWRSQ
jgi:hypothetical protein